MKGFFSRFIGNPKESILIKSTIITEQDDLDHKQKRNRGVSNYVSSDGITPHHFGEAAPARSPINRGGGFQYTKEQPNSLSKGTGHLKPK